MMKNQFGLKLKGLTFSYKRPYPEWYDLVALPTNYRLLEFAKFTGQDSISTIEYISRYLTQLDKASVEDVHRVLPLITDVLSLLVNYKVKLTGTS